MRIAFVLPDLPTEFTGGTEMVAWAEATALAARGHDVVCITRGGADTMGSTRREGVRIERLRGARTKAHELTNDELASKVVAAAVGADVVHLHHWRDLSGDLVQRLGERAPVCLTLHDLFATCPLHFQTPASDDVECCEGRESEVCASCLAPLVEGLERGELAFRLEERRSLFQRELDHAALVLLPSEFARGHLGRGLRLDPARTRVLRHGVVQDLPLPLPHGARPRVGEGPIRLLSFGNRCTIKGCLELVASLAAFPPGLFRLEMIGREVEAGFDAKLRAAAGGLELVLGGSFGPLELAAAARRADLAAFPSLALETYGLVVEEALALGLPAWVSDRGALPEAVRAAGTTHAWAGRVLPAGDGEAWTRAFAELVAAPRRLQDAQIHLPPPVRTVLETAAELEEFYAALAASAPAHTSRRAS